MKRFILSITIILSILISGCSYNDMNRLQFTTMSIFDINENGEIDFYSEHFVSDRGKTQDGGIVERLVLKATGVQLNEAFSNTQPLSPFPSTYDVEKAIAFTEKLARREQGLSDHIDLIERDQNITNKVFMFICEDDPMKILNTKMKDEEFIGIWLEDIMVFQGNEARILSIRANEYLNNRLKGSKVNVLPTIRVKQQPTEERIIISGAAVIINDRMVEKLTVEEIPIYKIFKNDLRKGRFIVDNPQEKGKLVGLSVRKSKTKDSLEYKDDEITLNIDIKMICTMGTVAGNLNLLDKNIRNELIKTAENSIKKRCEDLFSKFQKKDIDLFDIASMINRKFPNINMEDIDDIVRDIKLEVNVTIKIEGSQNITYSLN